MRVQKKDPSRREVRAWLVRKGIRQTEIKKALGHKSITQVNATLNGLRDDRRVLQYLLEKGCPKRYLNLPADMLEAA